MSPEAFGVLDVVNDARTTFALLDLEVRLDRRAAQNIIDARPIADLAALDAVKYVGPVAVDRLLAYARAHGRIPQPTEDELMILAVVNSSELTYEQLDDEIKLDARAARNIFAFRVGEDASLGTSDDGVFVSVAQLDAVPWVGASALGRILEYAKLGEPDPYSEGCESSSDCGASQMCEGIPRDGSTTFGKCVSTQSVPGEGAHCDQRTSCASGTLCAGTTLWGEGNCVPQWMAERFEVDGPIDLSQPRVTSSVVVNGLASVPVDITVTVRMSHPRADELRVTLTDPNGDSALLWERSAELNAPLARSFATNGISRDDEVNGLWTLTIEDLESGDASGSIEGWSLFIVSRYD